MVQSSKYERNTLIEECAADRGLFGLEFNLGNCFDIDLEEITFTASIGDPFEGRLPTVKVSIHADRTTDYRLPSDIVVLLEVNAPVSGHIEGGGTGDPVSYRLAPGKQISALGISVSDIDVPGSRS